MNNSLVLWIGGQANQKALANKIHKRNEISAIVVEKPQYHKKRKITIKKIIDKFRFRQIDQVWFRLLTDYNENYPQWPNVPTLTVENINCKETIEWTSQFKPDLIAVSGTRLIRKPVIETPAKYGIVNLHTGLSPYIKGGPNCTNWCISTDQMHLIGNTVMWIDEGIDSGKLINTELTKLNVNYSFLELHKAVMEHAHTMYVNTISHIFQKNGEVKSIAQSDIAKGKTYYSMQWNSKMKKQLLRKMTTLKKCCLEAIKNRDSNQIVTVDLV